MPAQFQPHPHDRQHLHQGGFGDPRSRGRRHTRAFTLIEIIACMGIFAIGFAAIAMMLPAGAIMQRDIESRGLGDITGRNSLEVMKGKGIQPLAYHLAGVYIGTTGLDSKILDGGNANADVDSAMYLAYPGYGSWNATPGSQAHASLAPYFDTDKSGYFLNETGYGAAFGDGGDCTNLAMGRIHAQKERPLPGVTLGRTSLLDFSFPSSVLDVTARSYFSTLLLTNTSTTPSTDTTWRYYTSPPSTQSWTLTAVTLRREGDEEWPEQVEGDPNAGAAKWTWTNNKAWTANWLCSNTIVDFRSAGGDPSLAGKPDPGPKYLWPRYTQASPDSPSSQGTVPATGGDPGNGANNGWMQHGQLDTWITNYNSPGWDLRVNLPLSVPVREAVASKYGYYPAGTGYRYPVPNLIAIQAIVYDRDNDLILLRYPQAFARKLVDTGKGEVGNARAKNYRKALGIDSALGANDGSGWIDRRLKVGDRFLSSYGGYAFAVKELLDPVAAAATAPGSGAVNWSDGTYQIVRVTPSLRTTAFTANKPIGRYSISRWNDPSPMSPIANPGMIVAPGPAEDGASPWASTIQLIDGGSPSQNGAVFRRWSNLTD